MRADPDSEEAKAAAAKAAERKERHARSKAIAAKRWLPRCRWKCRRVRMSLLTTGSRCRRSGAVAFVRGIPVADYLTCLDERALFLGQWGLRGALPGGEGPSYEDLVETEGRPRLRHWIDRLSTEDPPMPPSCTATSPAVSDGDTVHVLTEPDPSAPVRVSFEFPRQQRPRFLNIADFIASRERAIEMGRTDVCRCSW